MVQQIIFMPHAILRTPCREVVKPREAQRVARDLSDTVRAHQGLGLAAPQIGYGLQIFVTNIEQKISVYVNPKIVWRAKKEEEAEEGCLSLPEINVTVRRPTEIRLRAQDLAGNWFEQKLSGLAARVCQHECDHLRGVLIIDYNLPRARQAATSPPTTHALPA
jgi:peptide deformylase